MDRDLLRTLKPTNYGDHAPEPLTDYLERVRPLLHKFPDSVLAQWLHRHYHDAVSTYGWLGFEALRFASESWSFRRLKADIASFKEDSLDRIGHWARYYRDRDYATGDWLIAAMNAAGTWPEPIMILRNDSELCLPNGLPLGTPYHLVEGHHRLGFLVAMNEDQPESVLAEHRIWVLEVDPGAVSHEWPNV